MVISVSSPTDLTSTNKSRIAFRQSFAGKHSFSDTRYFLGTIYRSKLVEQSIQLLGHTENVQRDNLGNKQRRFVSVFGEIGSYLLTPFSSKIDQICSFPLIIALDIFYLIYEFWFENHFPRNFRSFKSITMMQGYNYDKSLLQCFFFDELGSDRQRWILAFDY